MAAFLLSGRLQLDNQQEHLVMNEAITMSTPVLAAGWSLLYLLFGGGFGGAVLIFIALKVIGR